MLAVYCRWSFNLLLQVIQNWTPELDSKLGWDKEEGFLGAHIFLCAVQLDSVWNMEFADVSGEICVSMKLLDTQESYNIALLATEQLRIHACTE